MRDGAGLGDPSYSSFRQKYEAEKSRFETNRIKMVGGVSESELIEFSDGTAALIKSDDPALPHLYSQQTEAYAYQVAKELGIDYLMGEVFYDEESRLSVHEFIDANGADIIIGRNHSIQKYYLGSLKEVSEGNYVSVDPKFDSLPPEIKTRLADFLVFDMVLFNTDRHGANQLVDKDGMVYAIDHARSGFKLTDFGSTQPTQRDWLIISGRIFQDWELQTKHIYNTQDSIWRQEPYRGIWGTQDGLNWSWGTHQPQVAVSSQTKRNFFQMVEKGFPDPPRSWGAARKETFQNHVKMLADNWDWYFKDIEP